MYLLTWRIGRLSFWSQWRKSIHF